MRARGTFLDWMLQDRPKLGATVRYVGTCQICSEFCVDTPTADEAREWCLWHVDATGHIYYELTATEYLDAVLD
ncbi:DUF7848 domain-containing protein [Streptomyces sp. CB02959]|nr:hypothetical protein CG747_46245 [Streptomyces sp. CB02959]